MTYETDSADNRQKTFETTRTTVQEKERYEAAKSVQPTSTESEPTTSAPPVKTPSASRAIALYSELLNAADSKQDIHFLLSKVDGSHTQEALRLAAKCLLSSPTSIDTMRARRLFTNLTRMDLPASKQDDVVKALIEALRTASTHSQAVQPARLLSISLFLRPYPGILESQSARETFAEKCGKAWEESLQRNSQDPMNDTQRLVEAVVSQGDLSFYASYADSLKFAKLAAELARISAEQNHPGAERALYSLMKVARVGTPVLSAKNRTSAQVALCDVIARTTEPARAVKAFLALYVTFRTKQPVSLSMFNDPAYRRSVAKQMEQIIRSGVRTGSGFQASVGATLKQVYPSAGVPTERLRQSYSSSGAENLLADLALTMLAFCERAKSFRAGRRHQSSELSSFLTSSNRVGSLAQKVVLSRAKATVPRKVVLEKLKKQLQSDQKCIRYQAIEELRRSDSLPAVSLLLDRLRAICKKTSSLSRLEVATMCRILRALSTMSDTVIPRELVRMISESETPFRATISRASSTTALYQEPGKDTSAGRPVSSGPTRTCWCFPGKTQTDNRGTARDNRNGYYFLLQRARGPVTVPSCRQVRTHPGQTFQAKNLTL